MEVTEFQSRVLDQKHGRFNQPRTLKWAQGAIGEAKQSPPESLPSWHFVMDIPSFVVAVQGTMPVNNVNPVPTTHGLGVFH